MRKFKDLKTEVTNWILDAENDDFYNLIDELEISEDEKQTLEDWFYGESYEMDDVKAIFKKLSNQGYIFASAFCFSYDINVEES
jgi:glucan-binding YG repeat protein